MTTIKDMLDWAHAGKGHLYITGPQGSGKTTLAKAVAAAASWGDVTFVDVHTLRSQFNGWLLAARVTVIELEGVTPPQMEWLNKMLFDASLIIERRGFDNLSVPNDKRWVLVGGDKAVVRFNEEVVEFSL